MQVGRLVARSLIGSLFVGHGTQKLMGWFGGPGLAGTEGMMGALSMHPARRNALAAGISETAGGALLIAGLGTPLAAADLIGVMITAIRKVHLPNGPWAAGGGWEYNAVLIAALLVLAEDGPGDLSLDAQLGLDKPGSRWALAALGLAAAASTASIEFGRRNAPAAPDSPADPDSAPFGETAGDPVTQD
jgi:putative oxidoreductase